MSPRCGSRMWGCPPRVHDINIHSKEDNQFSDWSRWNRDARTAWLVTGSGKDIGKHLGAQGLRCARTKGLTGRSLGTGRPGSRIVTSKHLYHKDNSKSRGSWAVTHFETLARLFTAGLGSALPFSLPPATAQIKNPEPVRRTEVEGTIGRNSRRKSPPLLDGAGMGHPATSGAPSTPVRTSYSLGAQAPARERNMDWTAA